MTAPFLAAPDNPDRVLGVRPVLAWDDPRHGSVNGYSYYRCRCEACRQAKIAANTEALQKRRAWVRQPEAVRRGTVRPRRTVTPDLDGYAAYVARVEVEQIGPPLSAEAWELVRHPMTLRSMREAWNNTLRWNHGLRGAA